MARGTPIKKSIGMTKGLSRSCISSPNFRYDRKSVCMGQRDIKNGDNHLNETKNKYNHRQRSMDGIILPRVSKHRTKEFNVPNVVTHKAVSMKPFGGGTVQFTNRNFQKPLQKFDS